MKHQTDRMQYLLTEAKRCAPVVTAVVHPVTDEALRGAVHAAEANLIEPVLIGPKHKIEAAAEHAGISIAGMKLIDQPHSHAAVECAVEQVQNAQVQMLMKGSLHTDELMLGVLKHQGGIRTDKKMSHVFVLDVPSYHKLLLISDCAINIAPDLDTKCDIVQNTINLAHAIGIKNPNVAILSAVETVHSNMQSTVDAAALCKMADRDQITGGQLEGPLAFDNAISKAAANEKHIKSDVAGNADILIAPNLEAGNMVAKQLVYLGDAKIAGIVLGARVPIVLTSRADSAEARVLSCAIGLLYYYRGVNV